MHPHTIAHNKLMKQKPRTRPKQYVVSQSLQNTLMIVCLRVGVLWCEVMCGPQMLSALSLCPEPLLASPHQAAVHLFFLIRLAAENDIVRFSDVQLQHVLAWKDSVALVAHRPAYDEPM